MKYTVITGATSGIGKELAFKYAKKGFNLILIARRETILEVIKNRLQGEYGVSVMCIVGDLASLEQAKSLFSKINDTYSVECLINNAGVAFFKPLNALVLDELSLETNLNLNVPILATSVLLNNLKQNNGSVINICSILSYLPNKNASVYVSTKHALLGFSNSLRIEESNLHVLTVHPATVKTNFFNDPSYLDKKGIISPEVVANAIYKAHKKRKRHLHLPKVIPLLRFVYFFLPRTVDYLNERFYSKK